ncbi:hypothetical protein [Kosakonia radicincitans]|nr:hypothetical protein [Kosakonia radicincitans]
MKRAGVCLLSGLVLIAAWRITGVLMDLTLLVIFIIMLVACRYWPRKIKK